MSSRRGFATAILCAALSAGACHGKPPVPPRSVIEADVAGWRYRRFQALLDVEVWAPDNVAKAFTASYVRDAAEKRGHLEDNDIVSAMVTAYTTPAGVARATVKFARRLAAESGYTVDESVISGVRLVSIDGNDEAWVLWSAGDRVVKLGGRGRTAVPEAMIAAYGEQYPSTMKSGFLEGALPPGADAPGDASKSDDSAAYDENNPSPDWKGKSPTTTQLPASTPVITTTPVATKPLIATPPKN